MAKEALTRAIRATTSGNFQFFHYLREAAVIVAEGGTQIDCSILEIFAMFGLPFVPFCETLCLSVSPCVSQSHKKQKLSG